jgi:hypothetical protein
MTVPHMFALMATGGAAPAFQPDDLSGLLIWLDADDPASITSSSGAVSQWSDRSGNARHVTQTTAGAKPTTGTTTQNGRNVLAFDGGDWLGNGSPFMQDAAATVCVVFYDTGDNNMVISEGRAGNDLGMWTLGNLITSEYARAYHENNSGTTRWDINTGNPTTSPIRITYQRTAADGSGNVTAYLYDSEGGSTSSAGNVNTFSPGLFTVGALRRIGVAGQISGWVAEILAYNQRYTGDDLDDIHNYLDTKWGL